MISRYLFLTLLIPLTSPATEFTSSWDQEPNRTWIGPHFWANRLQDWQIRDGRVECIAKKNQPMRTLHLLTHRPTALDGFKTSVETGPVLESGQTKLDSASLRGFLLGAGGTEMDFRAAAIVHQWQGPGGGIFAGVNGAGEVFFWDNEKIRPDRADSKSQRRPERVVLELEVEITGDQADLILRAFDNNGEKLSERELSVPADRVAGNLALVSDGTPGRGQQAWFQNWQVGGKGIAHHPSDTFGPVAATQYTLNKGVMKMTAQFLPIGEDEPHRAFLEVKRGEEWEQAAETDIIAPGWTATFRVEDWDASQDVLYRVVSGASTWSGIVKKNPDEKETIVVAGFTGNHNNSHAIGNKAGLSPWVSGMWFPHNQITESVEKHKPDLLFFSGDQVYEGKSPSFPDRQNIKLDYLYKWYLFCWAYRDLMRDIPTVTIPDDHDVYQGNIWGENGRPTHVDNAGGYVHPADFVHMVHRTQTSHLPDPPDPAPIEQDIPVYFTDLNWGRVSFAILEDRKFKSGCADHGLPPSGTNRPDHFANPDIDARQLDLPDLELLGKRQEKFLDQWAQDWTQADFKVALSQTIFANMATHHGPGLTFLEADLDSNGWPQSGRARAISALRKAFAFHLAGDQHLATVVHHGVENHEDAIYSFCVPSIANFYPRKWFPRVTGRNRPDGAPTWQGRHLDGFKNPVTVFAATNPGPDYGIEPKDLHNNMPGYGIVRLNKSTREITMECWKRSADPEDGPAGQYPGWPVTIQQQANYGRKAEGYLSPLEVDGLKSPVVQVRSAATKELIYSLRIQGQKFTPWVFEQGRYDVRIGDPDTGMWTELKGMKAELEPYSEARLIEF